MMTTLSKKTLWTLALLLGLPGAASAAIQGSCDGYFETRNAVGDIINGVVTRNDPIAVLRDQAEIYTTPDANSRVAGTLDFDERVFISREEDGYFLVNRDTRDTAQDDLGWVQGSDLLCQTRPLQNEDSIARKFYVRTQASYSDEGVSSITAKIAPQGDTCAQVAGRCRELTRFTLYYLYAIDEASQRVLLLSEPLNQGATPLIGWVDFDDGYLWDTRFGLRPRENLVFDSNSGEWEEGEERRACLYQTLEEAETADGTVCQVPILGGNRWFNYSLRIPVFERVEQGDQAYFRVALPSAGVGSGVQDDVLTQIAGLDEAIRLLRQLSNLDVFFLLDGTQSMKPHIDSIVGTETENGVLTSIQEAFTDDPRFANVQVRYGYRVYRDHYAGDFGIGEGMPFDGNCAPNEEELLANHERFQTEVRNIDTQFAGDGTVRDTDHEENLILGLAFAADDMISCPEHVKLLFVVGDTGYDLDTQLERGNPINSEEEVLSYLTQGFSGDQDPIIPFFVQVPRVGNTSAAYSAAYDKFTVQGRYFTERIGEHFTEELNDNSEINIADHFFSLDGSDPAASQTELVNYVLDRVSRFGDARPINEIIAELQGGTALVDIISTLSGGSDSVPALRLAQIEKRICDELGSACTERVFNDITEGYIIDNEDVSLDVWVDAAEFDNWRSKLDLMENNIHVTARELSRLIVDMMVDGLGKSIGDLSPAEMNMSIAEFLRLKQGLPTGSQTPLLNYSMNDLVYEDDSAAGGGARNLIEICELYRVARWLERHREIFAAVNNNEVPLFNLEDVDAAVCDMRYDTPELVFDGRERFPELTMSFRQTQMSNSILWLPNRFLP